MSSEPKEVSFMAINKARKKAAGSEGVSSGARVACAKGMKTHHNRKIKNKLFFKRKALGPCGSLIHVCPGDFVIH